jgi:hypothetical protein
MYGHKLVWRLTCFRRREKTPDALDIWGIEGLKGVENMDSSFSCRRGFWPSGSLASRHACPLRRRGSKASQSPSPNRLNPATVSVMHRPGKIASQGAASM